MSKNILKATLLGAAAVLTVGGTMLATAAPAEAQFAYRVRGGGYGGGYIGGPRFVGNRGFYGGRGYYGGRGFYGSRYGYYGRGYRNNGGAIAAGLIGGLALGAIASNSYNYNYGYAPVGYGYAPSYGYAPVSYGYGGGYGGCTVERRVRINRFGERVIRDVEVC